MTHVCDGHGASITFAGITTTARFRVIGSLRRYRDIIDDTALNDPDEKACQGKLKRHDEIECEYFADPDEDVEAVLISAGEVATTITYPPGTGQSNGATRQGQAFIASVSEPTLETGTAMIGTMTVKFSGAITTAPGS